MDRVKKIRQWEELADSPQWKEVSALLEREIELVLQRLSSPKQDNVDFYRGVLYALRQFQRIPDLEKRRLETEQIMNNKGI